MAARAKRLSNESLTLPPTHFLILTFLTILITLGYTVSILPSIQDKGNPSTDSAIIFSILVSVYVFFYNFTTDLNSAFDGVYQIRRSCTASHLLQTRWLISNHSLVKGEVNFDKVKETRNEDVQIKSPGLEPMIIRKDEFYPS